ncbi:cytosol non-specific dipeptidase [Anaeramoeba flamelloides]|uniref:Cytosol non-specific dipeptidase n=1 Tax=Anaeramoeba flamelloides TaxID=1746091 RepID=A0ABQ8XS88_9EUKA|nr:cytosol non-specific dipeptidase [Anaeramoeba flamelloides]
MKPILNHSKELLKTLGEPQGVYSAFLRICEIPHGSGNTKQLANELIEFGKSLGYEPEKDKVGNVLIRKPAYGSKSKSNVICIEAHMDMVCTKESNSNFDFLSDPIQCVVEEERYLTANGTSLGADNGLGMAMALDVLANPDLVHGPLEFLFTIDEETTMEGARHIEHFLEAKYLINVDTEDLGYVYVGSAGSIQRTFEKPILREKNLKNETDFVEKKISIKGLKGGHSALEINKEGGNSNKIIAQLLFNEIKLQFKIVDFQGGKPGIQNIIPSFTKATIIIPKQYSEEFDQNINKNFENILQDYHKIENLKSIKFKVETEEYSKSNSKIKPLTLESTKNVLSLILAIPHGVRKNDLQSGTCSVKSSQCLSVCYFKNNNFMIEILGRSSSVIDLQLMDNIGESIAILSQSKYIKEIEGDFPPWFPQYENNLALDCIKQAHLELFNKEMNVETRHSGLEPSLLLQNYPQMVAISFGPEISGAHSINEKIDMQSVDATHRLFIKTLELLANY